MKLIFFAAVLLAVAALAFLVTAKLRTNEAGGKATGTLFAKRPLTEREQAMFFRLSQAMPDTLVLAQVAFSALLDTKDRPTRATFDRKVADFVVCSKAFEVLAVVELDDSSHKNRAAADAARDTLLAKAGYRVLRFKNVPDTADVLKAFASSPG
ncbi:DUF2726 domain-containing protein [Roseateles microcysteis]|uniref:DUF2726 domain-containing protein n=1 Tax=Roseateles microcysteis TaxID=3119057 RepID=UPI002FE6B6DA